MAARAESHCIPGKGDAISEQMFGITVKVVEQTLVHNHTNQPVITERVEDWLQWVKSRPEELQQTLVNESTHLRAVSSTDRTDGDDERGGRSGAAAGGISGASGDGAGQGHRAGG